jgi:spermidine synthase
LNASQRDKTEPAAAGDPPAQAPSALSLLRHRWMLDWANPWEYTAHALRRELYHKRTEFQDVEIVETEGYGRCLILDGEVQSFEADEYIYHESLVHPAMLLHGDPRRVLVIGGGEGATLREVLRHRSVERAVMVDLDRELIAAAREYLPTFHQGSFDDPRVELRFQDGRAFVEDGRDRFDVAVIDVTNPMAGGPSYRLFTEEFYRSLRERLGPEGVVALQSDAVTLGSLDGAATIHNTVRAAWAHVFGCAVYLPAYTTEWSFTIACSSPRSPVGLDPDSIDWQIRQRLATPLRFYDGVAHQRMFHLPRYVRDAFANARSISCDAKPLQERFPGSSE